MISLKKFLDRMEQSPGREPGASEVRDLAIALRQAMSTLLEGLPLQTDSSAQGEPEARGALDGLLRRLQGAVKPFDVLEIAGAALSILEQNANAAQAFRRLAPEQTTGADRQAALAPALLHALTTLLEGWLRHYRAGKTEPNRIRAIEESLERLRGSLEPFNVIEITGEALTSIDEDLRAARNRYNEVEEQLRVVERQADLGSASLRALQFVLDRAPYGRNPGAQASNARQIIAGLTRRLDGSLAPEDVIGIARAAVSAIEEHAAAEIKPQSEILSPEPQTEIDTVLAERLRTLLLSLPLTAEPNDQSGDSTGTVVAALAESLGGIHKGSQVVDVLDQVIAELKRDARDRANMSAELRHQGPGTGDRDISQALRQGLRLLIEGLRPVAPVDKASGHAGQAIDALLRRLEKPFQAFDVLEIANEALTCVQRDRDAARVRHQQYSEELQCIISMLTVTLAGFSSRRDGSIERLHRIERQIEQASMVEDLRTLKSNLADCLTEVREAATAQQKQATETIRAFENQIQAVRSRIPKARETGVDDASRLRTQSETPPVEYIAVFVLDRENSIAARFGDKARDAALNLVRDRLREALMPSDRVVRWKGAAFLASLKREGTISDVRAELSIAATIPASLLVELGSRSIRLPVSVSWTVFPQAHNGSLDQSFEKVDQFIARARPGNA